MNESNYNAAVALLGAELLSRLTADYEWNSDTFGELFEIAQQSGLIDESGKEVAVRPNDSLEIRGRRWFSNGNTYHATVVNFNGRSWASPVTYGYEDQYIQTGLELLHAAGLFLECRSPSALSMYCTDNGIEYCRSARDVKRKKELSTHYSPF